jgi:hypothetical protein
MGLARSSDHGASNRVRNPAIVQANSVIYDPFDPVLRRTCGSSALWSLIGPTTASDHTQPFMLSCPRNLNFIRAEKDQERKHYNCDADDSARSKIFVSRSKAAYYGLINHRQVHDPIPKKRLRRPLPRSPTSFFELAPVVARYV